MLSDKSFTEIGTFCDVGYLRDYTSLLTCSSVEVLKEEHTWCLSCTWVWRGMKWMWCGMSVCRVQIRAGTYRDADGQGVWWHSAAQQERVQWRHHESCAGCQRRFSTVSYLDILIDSFCDDNCCWTVKLPVINIAQLSGQTHRQQSLERSHSAGNIKNCGQHVTGVWDVISWIKSLSSFVCVC